MIKGGDCIIAMAQTRFARLKSICIKVAGCVVMHFVGRRFRTLRHARGQTLTPALYTLRIFDKLYALLFLTSRTLFKMQYI